MKASTAKELLKKVQKDYEAIAEEFSKTRQYAWPEFLHFKKYINEGNTIVDLGCGNGRLYDSVKDLKNIKYIGIDNNKKFIQLAQKKYSSTQFVIGDALNIPLNKEADIVLSIASLHHIASSRLRKKCVQEIRKIVKKDGYVIVTVWNLFQKRYMKYIIKSLINYFVQFGKYDWNDTFIPWGDSGINRYYHAFTTRELKKLFESNGFEVVELFKTNNICLVCRKK
jgi:alkylated DNA repair protein alkB family protein 8